MAKTPNLLLNNIRFAFRPNFTGEKRQFNDEGDRNFTIRFDDETQAMDLAAQGWNIKEHQDIHDGERFWSLEVAVRYEFVPPAIHRIGTTTGKDTVLDSDTVALLDNDIIVRMDVDINPYHWQANGKTGIKAYLASAYVAVQENEMEISWSKMLEDWDRTTPLFE